MGMLPAQQATAEPRPGMLAACIDMFVGVYVIGYAWDPRRFWPFALLGLCGKVLGPAGWVLHHALGHLPWRSLWVNLFNDLIWWPAFFRLLLTVRREYRARKIRL
jgi:small multidrug resistance pump